MSRRSNESNISEPTPEVVATLQQRIAALETELASTRLQMKTVNQTNERLSRVFDWAPIILWGMDGQGIVTFSEGKGLQRLGLKPGEMVGVSAVEAYADQPEALKVVQGGLNGKSGSATVAHGDLQYQTTWHSVVEDGVVREVVAVSVDITDTAISERELRDVNNRLAAIVAERTHELEQNEARYRTISELSADYSYEVFRKNDGSIGRVWATEAFERITGYTYEEADEQGWDYHVHPEDKATVGNGFWDLDNSQRTQNEYRILTKDGHRRWIREHSRISRIDDDGTVYVVGAGSDITEQRTALTALAEANERLALATDNARLAIWDWRPQQDDLIVNDRWWRMLGYEPKKPSANYQTWEQLLHPGDRPGVIAGLQAHLAGESPTFISELRMKHADGHWRWLETEGKVVERDADQQPIRVIGVHRDIHDGKLAQLKLKLQEDGASRQSRELRALHRLAIDLSRINNFDVLCMETVEQTRAHFGFERIAIWLVDGQNPDYIRGTYGTDENGQTRDERSSRIQIDDDNAVTQIVRGESNLHYAVDDVLFNDKGEPVGQGEHVIAAIWDGNQLIGSMSIDNLLSATNPSQRIKRPLNMQLELIRLLASMIGVLFTRTRTFDSLQESEMRFRELAENIREVFWITDVTYDEVLYVNPAMSNIFGMDIDAFKRRPSAMLDLVHPSDIDRVRTVAKRSKTAPATVEYRYRRGDQMRWAWSRTFPIQDEAGEIYRIATLTEDITEWKQAQHLERLQHAKLSKLDRLQIIGQMTAGLAHYLNQPLTSIQNYAAGLIRTTSQENASDNVNIEKPQADHVAPRFDTRPILENISAEALRAAQIIQKIRRLSDSDDDQKFQQQLCDINRLLEEVVQLKHHDLRARSVQIETELVPDLSTIVGDEVRLQQAFLNLLQNAIDAALANSTDGDIWIATRQSGPQKIHIWIVDSGQGLDAVTRDNIFTPFFTTKADRIGLGLKICQRIINDHGGTLEFLTPPTDAPPLGGAACRITLPVHEYAVHDT